MTELFQNSVFFGVCVSLLSYFVGMLLQKKTKLTLCNPLLISIALTMILLVVLHVDYDSYYEGAKYLSYLLTPATVCLAVPLYEQFQLLKKNYRAVLAGIVSGVITSLCSVLALACIFRLEHIDYVTLLPKSITTAIGMGLSQEMGGYVAVTVAVIIVTGLLGSLFADKICRLFRITDPIAQGVAIGTSSHAMGTAHAMELGPVTGAMSSLSIVVAGILTVIGANIFSHFL